MLKLLVPVGRSKRSLQAVRHAAFLYHERCVSEVVLLNVQPPLESTRLEAFYPLEELRAMEAAAANEALERAARILDDAHVRYSLAVQVGPLAPTIAHCADEQRCDEIVVAAPPRGVLHAIRHIARQSVLDRLVRIARVPVTAVR